MSTDPFRGPHRRALLEATVAEFSAAGYDGASLNRIIRAAGISKSSFYHAIGSKAELLDAVVTSLVAEVRGRWTPPAPASLAGPGFWDRVEDMLDDLARLTAEDPALALLGRIIYLPGASAPDARTALLESLRAWVLGALEAGRSCGAISTDLPAPLQGAAAFGMLRGLDERALGQDGAGEDDRDQLRRAPSLLLRRMLAP
ncbi:TetR/AcrR family transcriptional regulator [Brachybacterium hainanense]|uniref:TetR/AcrR family transcriptional regulator n=1 Tax=Brachybacterium hainanense TaxID=1541174 RepID=A0ABV6RAR3_9MICO